MWQEAFSQLIGPTREERLIILLGLITENLLADWATENEGGYHDRNLNRQERRRSKEDGWLNYYMYSMYVLLVVVIGFRWRSSNDFCCIDITTCRYGLYTPYC